MASNPTQLDNAAARACPECGTPLAGLSPGPVSCRSCGEALYRIAGDLVKHRGTVPMIPMHVAAARLRNHLRRLAITRLGLIDGDCYLLPYYRVEGSTPGGEDSFTVLGTRLGDTRLEYPFLPPGNLRPYEEPDQAAAGPSGEENAILRVLPPTISWREAAARVRDQGWEARRALELIHYPFWLMRVDDCGRMEGAWVDGIEARVIFHRIRLTPPVPSGRARALWSALPAAAAVAGSLAAPALALPLAALAWVAGIPLLHGMVLRRWNG